MSAIEQAKDDSNDDCESSDDSLPESQGKHDVVVTGIAATVEVARLVGSHWHCVRSDGCITGVFLRAGVLV